MFNKGGECLIRRFFKSGEESATINRVADEASIGDVIGCMSAASESGASHDGEGEIFERTFREDGIGGGRRKA